MASKLSNLKLSFASLVKSPAHPGARVAFWKSRDVPSSTADPEAESPPASGHPLTKAATKTEGGKDFPKSAYAYTPDDAPSRWKLRLIEEPGGAPTAKQVGMAVAALGEGFRGQKADIPADDLPAVKAKVRAAWKKANPDKDDSDLPEAIKKELYDGLSMLGDSGQPYGTDDADDDDNDFQDNLDDRSDRTQLLAMRAEVYDYLAALADVFDDCLDDDCTLADADRANLIRGSVDQFQTAVEAALPKWLAGQPALADVAEDAAAGDTEKSVSKAGRKQFSAARLERLKTLQSDLTRILAEAEPSTAASKGASMGAIDKAALPADVRAEIERLEAALAKAQAAVAKGQPVADEDIWKGVPDALRKQFEAAEQRATEAERIAKSERDQRETREFVAKAKEFPHLVQDPEKLGPVLKSLAATNADAFSQLETILRAANEAVEKAAIWVEIGSASQGNAGSAEAEIEQLRAKAVEKSTNGMTPEQATLAALQANPDLYAAYEAEQRARLGLS